MDLVSVCEHSIAKRAPPFSFLSVTDVVCARRRCCKKEFPPLGGTIKSFCVFFSFPALKLWTSFMCPISCFPLTNSVCSLSLYCITSFQPPGISCSCFVDLVLFIRFFFFFLLAFAFAFWGVSSPTLTLASTPPNHSLQFLSRWSKNIPGSASQPSAGPTTRVTVARIDF